MFLLSSDSAKTTPAAGFESLPSPSFFSMANAYDMTGPVEILQLRHSPDKENNFFTLFENNISGVYYASFSPLEEVSDLIPIDYTSLQSMTRLHSHEYYEFMFLIDGEIYQNIEHFRHYYPAGGCCLVDPHVLHAEEYATACRVLFFKISQSFMQQILAFPVTFLLKIIPLIIVSWTIYSRNVILLILYRLTDMNGSSIIFIIFSSV